MIEQNDNSTLDINDDPNLQELRSIVTDCGLSQTTLEEVFMIVTGKKQQKEKKELPDYKPPALNQTYSSSFKSEKFEEEKDYNKRFNSHDLIDSADTDDR